MILLFELFKFVATNPEIVVALATRLSVCIVAEFKVDTVSLVFNRLDILTALATRLSVRIVVEFKLVNVE